MRILKSLSILVVISVSSLFSLYADAQPLPKNLIEQLSPAERSELQKLKGRIDEEKTNPSDPVDLAVSGEPLVPVLSVKSPVEPAAESTLRDNIESTRFGVQIFSQEVSTFAPTDDAPVPSFYRLGVGDELIVHLFGKENEKLNFQIGRSGDINFPRLGSITLAGLTFDAARDLIKTRIDQQLIGTEAVVSMGRLRAINVLMVGEVKVPGAYSVSALTTVTQALFQAGGISEIGTLRSIQVLRSGETIATFDVYDLLLNGDVSNDIRLRSGDVIFVPPYKGVVTVEGEVKRPMDFEITGKETIADIVAMAGGLTSNAYPTNSIVTSRLQTLGSLSTKNIDLNDPDQAGYLVTDGDLLRIPSMGGFVAKSIELKGAVARPGTYGWVPEMRVSDLISISRRDLLENSDLTISLLVRRSNQQGDLQVFSFSLAEVLEEPRSAVDPKLEEMDQILVFSRPSSKATPTSQRSSRATLLQPLIDSLQDQSSLQVPAQIVSVSGDVRSPGQYPLVIDGTVDSLIILAGGLNESAYSQTAELLRRTSGVDDNLRVSLLEVDLERKPPGKPTLLQSRDHLLVRKVTNWSARDSIVIEGEVAFPGTYLLRPNETLSDLVRRAGGINYDTAALDAAIFTRRNIAELESERAKKFAREIQSTFAKRLLTEEFPNQTISEVQEIVKSLETFEGNGRLLVDLNSAMQGLSDADVLLTDGDVLTIPKLSNTVTVIGEVRESTTHTYNEFFSFRDYIDLSGGFSERASKSDVYIVRANGTVVRPRSDLWLFERTSEKLYPGDTIVVPINIEYRSGLESWKNITQVLYQSIVSIAAVARL